MVSTSNPLCNHVYSSEHEFLHTHHPIRDKILNHLNCINLIILTYPGLVVSTSNPLCNHVYSSSVLGSVVALQLKMAFSSHVARLTSFGSTVNNVRSIQKEEETSLLNIISYYLMDQTVVDVFGFFFSL